MRLVRLRYIVYLFSVLHLFCFLRPLHLLCPLPRRGFSRLLHLVCLLPQRFLRLVRLLFCLGFLLALRLCAPVGPFMPTSLELHAFLAPLCLLLRQCHFLSLATLAISVTLHQLRLVRLESMLCFLCLLRLLRLFCAFLQFSCHPRSCCSTFVFAFCATVVLCLSVLISEFHRRYHGRQNIDR